jgi:bloom syndrome protein
MTRHNLAIHISWLLSSEVTPPVGVHTVPAASTTVSAVSAETIYADSEEEDIGEQIPGQLPSPSPNRVPTVNVDTEFQRPPLPPKVTPNPPLREPPKSFADKSMGKLSSASRSARPGLVSQPQLATPASTTGSTSSLMRGYSDFLTKNGKLQRYHRSV